MTYSRYAIYYTPSEGPFARFGAAWLGWDITTGREAARLDFAGLPQITETPSRYGFHATLKAPFRLASGATLQQLQDAVTALAEQQQTARCAGLELTRLGRFLALTPTDEATQLSELAAACVIQLDSFRAPLGAAERAKRKPDTLPERKRSYLDTWGYPHVLDAFRFHMTLSNRMPKADLPIWEARVRAALPDLPRPFTVTRITLAGERADGRFEQILCAPLVPFAP